VILPSAYSSKEELEKDLKRRGENAGFTPFDADSFFSHSDSDDEFVAQAEAASDFLSHYGVKGMKWGQSRAAKKASRESPSDEARKVGEINTRVKSHRSTKMLTNKELQDAITRMNLEQQYSRLTGGMDKSRRERVADFMNELITGTVKDTVRSAAKGQVQEAVEKQTQTGKYDPVAVAKRQAELASAKARTRQANAS